MKEITIEELAYLIQQAKDNNKPQPIFFLGAGASVTGNIPLARDITKDILNKYQNSPFIKKLNEKEQYYSKLMECLLPHQRNELLKKYIDEAKINVTHIYLAQLMKSGFVDYVLTVNFDNLMLRALSLFNEFPSTYDMAILKDLTTTTFKIGSVVYLHGQHHGLWLLNTEDEMEKVKSILPRIFDSIKNERPWIFIGYSGSDPVFEHIKELGRFDNGLYWVGYREDPPSQRVQEFLTTPNTNASLIKGYDADAFMLKLNDILGLTQPEILDKPFSSLQAMLNEINDINDEEHFKGVKERLEMAKKDVTKSIRQFEKKENVILDEAELHADKLKKDIIDLLISENYDQQGVIRIEERAKQINDQDVNSLLAELYLSWGIDLGNLAKTKEGKEANDLYQKAIGKYEKAIAIKPDKYEALNNWGNNLGNLAKSNEGKEADDLYHQAFEKFNKAVEIKPDLHEALFNWGTDLGNLAKTKEGKEADELYHQAFEKYNEATKIKPDKYVAFNNWGTDLGNLAKTKKGKEADELYHQAFEQYQRATEIKPDYHRAFYNWAYHLTDLAKTKTGKEADDLYHQAFEQYQKAVEIKPDYHRAFYNWGTDLGKLAEIKEGKEADELYRQAFEKFQKAIEIEPELHEAFNNWGGVLVNSAKTKEGKEADELYHQAFEKFQKAVAIKPDKHEAFNNWGNALADLAKTKEGKEANELYQKAVEVFYKAIEHGESSYNLSCVFALKGEKENALKYLERSLSRNEIEPYFVEKDEDWKDFNGDKDFIMLIEQFKK